MGPWTFAARSIAGRPMRAVLGIVGIAAVGALLFDMLLLSRGLVLSFRDLLDDTGFDVRITATDALPGFGPRLDGADEHVERVAALPEIAAAVAIRAGRVEVARTDGRGPRHATDSDSAIDAAGARPAGAVPEGDAPLVASLLGAESREREPWTLLEGVSLSDAPAGDAGEIPLVVDSDLAAGLGVGPGDTLDLVGRCSDDAIAGPGARARIVGIVGFPFERAGEWSAAVSLDRFDRLCGERHRQADLVVAASAPDVPSDRAVAAVRAVAPDLYVFSNASFIERFERRDFSYFRQISFVLATITLAFAALLLATLLTVSANQRLAEIAAMRAMGFSRRRIAADVLAEAVLFVAAGAVLALLLGAGLARWLDGILRGMPDLPEDLHFFVFWPGALTRFAAALVLTTIAASAYPVYLATRLPIASTLRKECVS